MSPTKSEEIAEPAETFHESLIWAIVVVFVVGLGATIGLIAVMKNLDFNTALTIAFPIISFLLMLAIEGVFIWKLLGPRQGAGEIPDTERLNQKELGGEQELWMTDPASVTEHTTQTFEPIQSEPTLK